MPEWEADHETVRRLCLGARDSIHKAKVTAERSRKDVPVQLLSELETAYGRSCLAMECAVGLYTAHQDTVRELSSQIGDLRQKLNNLELRYRKETGDLP